MNPAEFHHAITLGLGRAILWLRHNDWRPHAAAIELRGATDGAQLGLGESHVVHLAIRASHHVELEGRLPGIAGIGGDYEEGTCDIGDL